MLYTFYCVSSGNLPVAGSDFSLFTNLEQVALISFWVIPTNKIITDKNKPYLK